MTGTIEKEIAELERCIKYPHTDKPVVELAKLVVLKRWLAHAEAQDKRIRDLEAELESRKTQMEALCEKVNIAEASSLTKDEARGIIKETYNEDYIRYGYEQKQTIRTFLTDFFAKKGVKLKDDVKA
jgi:hypothetical protein